MLDKPRTPVHAASAEIVFMAYRKTVLIEKQNNGEGVGASYFVRPGSRDRPWIWWNPEDLPPYAHEGGRFVIERIPNQLRPSWTVIGPAP